MKNSYIDNEGQEWKSIDFNGYTWKYLKIGNNRETFIIFPGGLRRPVYGGSFINSLVKHHQIIYPIYPRISNLRELSEGINEVLEEEKIGKAHIYGSSFGGLMVQAFNHFFPEKVDKLVISNSGTTSKDSDFDKKVNRSLFLLKILPGFVVRSIMKRSFCKMVPKEAPDHEQAVQSIKNMIDNRLLDKAEIICHFQSLRYFQAKLEFTQTNTKSFQHKMLIITAENDPGVSNNATKSLHEVYPNAQFHHFTEGGHMPLLLKTDEYLELIFNFLRI